METESEGSPNLHSLKSKQERVRDNQRRSRARRREYCSELESQVRQCYVACREADLQRAAFAQLQAENARMRELLRHIGLNPDHGKTSEQENMPQYQAGLAVPLFPQLNPKLPTADISTLPPTANQNSTSSICCPTSPSSAGCVPQLPMSTGNSQVCDNQYGYQLIAPPIAPTSSMPVIADVFPGASYNWSYHSDADGAGTCNNQAAACHACLVPPNVPLWPADGHSISSLLNGERHG